MASVDIAIRMLKTGTGAQQAITELQAVRAAASSPISARVDALFADMQQSRSVQREMRELERTIASIQARAAAGMKISLGDMATFQDAKAKLAGLEAGLHQLDGTAARMKLGENLARAGSQMTMALTLPLAGIAVMATKAASDTVESFNKMKVVFGSASHSVELFASDSASSLGISRRNALEAASTFGNLFKTIGMGEREAAVMSIRLVELAADLASLHNISPEVALEKLRSGLVGEAEPMRQVGVLLNETAVKAKAMEMGFSTVGGQLSEAAKVQARYALILEQTKVAQGDSARTAGELAGSTRRAKAELENAAAELGTNLIPVATIAAREVAGLAKAFSDLPNSTQTAVVNFGLLLAVAGPLASGLGAVLKIAGPLAAALGAIAASPVLPVIGAGLVVGGAVAAGGNKVSAPDDPKAIHRLTDPGERLIDLSQRLARATQELKLTPDDPAALAYYSRLTLEMEALKREIALVGSEGPKALHALSDAAAAALAKQQALAAVHQSFNKAERGRLEEDTDSLRELFKPETQKQLSAWTSQGREERNRQEDEAERQRTQRQQSAAERAAQAIESAFNNLASNITSNIQSAIDAAKGLKDLTGGPGSGGLKPGENGPFERLYRIIDVAANLGKPGSEAGKWAAQEGVSQEQAKEIGKQFQMGNLFAPGVFERIDWAGLAQYTTAQMEGQKISQYAGQAVAGLMAAGQPLTPDAVKAAVDELAAKDKDGVVPNLQALNTAVATLNADQNTGLASVVAAINGLKLPPGTVNGQSGGALGPSITVNVNSGAVQVEGDKTGKAKTYADAIVAAIQEIAASEQRAGIPAPMFVAGNP